MMTIMIVTIISSDSVNDVHQLHFPNDMLEIVVEKIMTVIIKVIIIVMVVIYFIMIIIITSPLMTWVIFIKWSSTTFAKWYVGNPSLLSNTWSSMKAFLKLTAPKTASITCVSPGGIWKSSYAVLIENRKKHAGARGSKNETKKIAWRIWTADLSAPGRGFHRQRRSSDGILRCISASSAQRV